MTIKIDQILAEYQQDQPRRALGGIYALAGFNYQLRLYIADLIEALVNPESLEQAGQVFIEALSDIAHQQDNKLICIQVKRTLTRKALHDAATELLAIDDFLSEKYPLLHEQFEFGLISEQGDESLTWSHVADTHSAKSRVEKLLTLGRLQQPRLEPDPSWRAISIVWRHLKDPYGFLRFSLDRTLTCTTDPGNAARIRDDICERFTQARAESNLVGQLLCLKDVTPSSTPSATLEFGRAVTLDRLRDQQYMRRDQRQAVIHEALLQYWETSCNNPQPSIHVLWLAGRSGVGKSVLLLQTLERLVHEGRRVLWLKGASEQLEPTLRAIANAPAELGPEFIAIDDLYDRDARSHIDLAKLSEFIDESGSRHWPCLITCGPSDFANSFKEESCYRGFELHTTVIQPVAATETEDIKCWYRERTGREPKLGSAFTQAQSDDGGLFISLAVEMVQGDLRAFAQRFAQRIRSLQLEEALRLPLALNRLYMLAPYDWLSDSDREKLASLNVEGDFKVLDLGEEGQRVRLTHPHLGDALYRALRQPANATAYSNDLIEIFKRALVAGNSRLLIQLLRFFSAPRIDLVGERFAIIDEVLLATQCASIWQQHQSLCLLDADAAAEVATSWACWFSIQPVLSKHLGNNLFQQALQRLDTAYKHWPWCWLRLAFASPNQPALITWADIHLASPERRKHPMWSLVWEACLQQSTSHTAWRELGLSWLQDNLRRPDWHFVWKKLLPPTLPADLQNDEIFRLGQTRLAYEQDSPVWAYVVQDLLVRAKNDKNKFAQLTACAFRWLEKREDRAEWAHVWRVLVDNIANLPKTIEKAELLGKGYKWLAEREDRTEWAHVWRVLVDNIANLPKTIEKAELLGKGYKWLAEREDRAEWAHVWQVLVDNIANLPKTIEPTEILGKGYEWLAAREDRAEWTYVWRVLVDNIANLPKTIEKAELLGKGYEWLAEREGRTEWTYVWRVLVDNISNLSKTIEAAELLGKGYEWLAEREDRTEWTHVWQVLVDNITNFPKTIEKAELLGKGYKWLAEREDRAEWTYVWRVLVDNIANLPKTIEKAELLGKGYKWLAEREDRAEWTHVWETLLDNIANPLFSVTLDSLLAKGNLWLSKQQNRADWPVIWWKLIYQPQAFTSKQERESLINLGILQLAKMASLTLPDASRFIEGLLDVRCTKREFIEQATVWLNLNKKEKTWRVIATKFIALLPENSDAIVFAQELAQGINACANKSFWLKLDPIMEPLVSSDIMLKPEIQNFCMVLKERHKLPVWQIAKEHLFNNNPVQGTVINNKGNYFLIELDIGLIATSAKSDGNTYSLGAKAIFYIISVNPQKYQVSVSHHPRGNVELGTVVTGRVTEHKMFGIFVKIEHMNGLIHQSTCLNFPKLLNDYPIGSEIQVEVIGITDKGLKLTYAGTTIPTSIHLSSIQVGDQFDGVITNIECYGLFIDIGGVSGLLHRSKLEPGIELSSHFSKGQNIRIQIAEKSKKGIHFSLA